MEQPANMNMEHMSPPYPPKTAALGGHASIIPDVPIASVFLLLFICGAVINMTILQVNRKRGHKFLFSGMIFGLCMARITAMVLRIASATRPHNIRLAIASQIFTAAGVILLFILNLIFVQRIFRAQHPRAGWHPAFYWFFFTVLILIPISLVMLITAVIQSFYTLNANTHRIDRDLMLYGSTYFAFVSFLPIPIVLVSLALPRKARTEKFGSGRFRNKIYVLLLVTTLSTLGALFRMSTSYKDPRPANDPPGYFSKACFYIFNFTIEIIVIALYVALRVDRRFWVPDNAHGPGAYSSKKIGWTAFSGKKPAGHDDEGLTEDKSTSSSIRGHIIAPEEAIFDNETAAEEAAQEEKRKGDRDGKVATNV